MSNLEEKNLSEITAADLDSLVGREENERLEFKEAIGNTPNFEIAKDLSCLANARGGLIIIGAVEEPATTACLGFKSVTDPPGIRKKIEQLAIDRVKKPLPLTVRILNTSAGAVVVLVSIPKCREPHAAINDAGKPEYWKRFGKHKRVMSHDELMAAAEAAQHGLGELDVWDQEWVVGHRDIAHNGANEIGARGYLEAFFDFSQLTKLNLTQPALIKAAKQSVSSAPGHWPIGAVIPGKCSPQAKANEIVAEIPDGTTAGIGADIPYTYWALSANAQFYTLEAFVEDLDLKRALSKMDPFLFLEYRLMKITELILYATRLFNYFASSGSGMSVPALARFRMRHSGLSGRIQAAHGIGCSSDLIPPLRWMKFFARVVRPRSC